MSDKGKEFAEIFKKIISDRRSNEFREQQKKKEIIAAITNTNNGKFENNPEK